MALSEEPLSKVMELSSEDWKNETEKQMPWVSVYACGIARWLCPPWSNQDTRSLLTLSETDKHLQP